MPDPIAAELAAIRMQGGGYLPDADISRLLDAIEAVLAECDRVEEEARRVGVPDDPPPIVVDPERIRRAIAQALGADE